MKLKGYRGLGKDACVDKRKRVGRKGNWAGENQKAFIREKQNLENRRSVGGR